MKKTVLAACLLTLSAAQAQAPADPYLWLEDLTGEKAMAWVRERNAATEAVLKAQDLDLASGLRFERHAFTLLAGTADRNEGIRAFQEKRRADFHGR